LGAQVKRPEVTDEASPELAWESEPRGISDWSDTRLVRECLEGNERAWDALIQKYKRLIYSIPIKYGATQDDAADIFQSVCLELFSELGNLRKAESIKSWLISVAAHQAYHWKKRQRPRDVELDGMQPELAEAQIPATEVLPPEMLQQIQEEQRVREALRQLPPRCEEMIRLLFYSDPPLPYSEVAQRLGLATGSIGFIRGRCLKRLQKILNESGF
jgi:RNA polymerase sigma factor (sigma-70 family)